MLFRALRFAFLGTVFSLGWVASATAADVLDQPKALCDYFESLGMKTQFRWPTVWKYFCFIQRRGLCGWRRCAHCHKSVKIE